jgi:predicted dehydrogenase
METIMPRRSRRDFLKCSAVGGLAAVGLTGVKASAQIIGANDRLRVAVVGINNRGQTHIGAYLAMKGKVEIAYMVDVDSRLLPRSSKLVENRTGATPRCVQDLRVALDDKNVDIVSIASPNHWHSLQAIWACQANKDVYVEKPCSHNIFEGRKLVEAARKYDRIVQHGTQSRTNLRNIAETAAARSGKYGKLLVAYGLSGKPRKSIGTKQPKEPPKELNYDLWLGR